MQTIYDAIIIGGGPAGLSAALMLGRCRRRILVCDSGRYRNAYSHGVHGFFTRDCTPPSELLQIGREQLAPYGVEYRGIEVTSACVHEVGFHVTLKDGSEHLARKLLVATGVRDRVPELEGMEQFYGRSVHHCPYCDGWEWRDQPLAVYGQKIHGYALALSLKNWSEDVALLTDGPAGLNARQREELKQFDILVYRAKIARLEGTDGKLERVVFANGESLARSAMFFSTGQDQHCDVAKNLGCIFSTKGVVETTRRQETNVRGLYVVGDAAKDVQFVIVAAAEGAKAAEAINEALMAEDRARRLSQVGVPVG
ncbi:MAG: NAD(P)/FAD-dependent oxidoreductase [Acidobacteriaceae bacterium]|nr:NAD(P)/FAD-dependent oxidoreductase [Acidobacteriaceae bacterium]